MKNKTIYLLLFLIFILVLILFLKSQFDKSPNKSVGQNNLTPVVQLSTFKLIATNISSGTIGITEPIKLQFDQPIISNIIYTIEPQKEEKIGIGATPNEIIIDPVDAWNFDTSYTLKILKSTKSVNGQYLDKDYTYTFKTPPYSGI